MRGHKGLPWKAPEEMPLSYLQGGKCHYTSPASRTGAVVCFVGRLPCGDGTQLGLWKAGWNYCNVCCAVFAGWHLSLAAWLWDVLSFSRDGQGSCCAYGAGGPRCGRGAQLPSVVQQLWTWWNRAWPLGRSESSGDEQRGCALSFSAHLMPVCLSRCFSHQPLHCSQAPKTCRTQGRSTNGATFIARNESDSLQSVTKNKSHPPALTKVPSQ